MADVHRIPAQHDVERAASEWIARLKADDVSPDDVARFEHWRSAHPMHARLYDGLDRTWARFAAMRPLVQAHGLAQSVSEATEVPNRWRRVTLGFGVAAAVGAVVVGWRRLRPARLVGSSFSTAIGQQAEIGLSDGSRLVLNSDSLARVRYSDSVRMVHLEHGEGYFTVAHEVKRPFWVLAGGSWVGAVGTAFDVYLRPSDVRVIVAKGTVKVGTGTAVVGASPADDVLRQMPVWVLRAGEQASLRGDRSTTRRLSSALIAQATSWRHGVLYFDGQTLGEVVATLGRYTPLTIIVRDSRLRGLPIGGTFRTNSQGAQTLLRMLQQRLGLKIRRAGTRVYVDPPQGKNMN